MADPAEKLEPADPPADAEWLKPHEVAKILRIGRNQVYEAIERGDIPARRFGKSIRVRRAALQKE